MDKSTKEKIKVSKAEIATSVPFSRRELAMVFIIAHTALSDADILDTINPKILFKTDDTELDELSAKIKDFLEL